MLRESRMKRLSAQIWREVTDTPVPPDLSGRLATVAWRMWAKAGNRWPSALARAASRALEETRLFGGHPLTLLVERWHRLGARRPTGRVILYPHREPVLETDLQGFAFQPSGRLAEGARASTDTMT